MASKVLLINPSMRDYYQRLKVRSAISRNPPLNLALIAGALRGAGAEVEVLDLDAAPELERSLPGILTRLSPAWVGFSVRTPLFEEASRLARRVRRLLPDVRLVAGGVHPSVCATQVVGHPFDIAVINEGENAAVELTDGRPLSEVGGIAYLQDGQLIRTPARARTLELDALPFAAWRLFDLRRYRQRSLVAPNPPVADLESSRGCSAHCIYCTRSVLGSRFRAKSPARLVEEVSQALDAGFRSFNLVDDCFTADLPRAIAVCDALRRRGFKVPWTLTNGVRVSQTSDAFFRAAARAGLKTVAFGLESGSQALLDRVGKGTTLAQGREAVRSARLNGITTLGYFMVGLPGETVETLEETLLFARSLELDYAKFSITVPLPGTPLYDQWRDLINPDLYETLNIHQPNIGLFSHPDLSWEELETFLRRAYRRVYFRPEYLLKRLGRDLRDGNLLYNLRSAVGMRW